MEHGNVQPEGHLIQRLRVFRWAILCMLLGLLGAPAQGLPQISDTSSEAAATQDIPELSKFLPKGRLPCTAIQDARLRLRISAGSGDDTPAGLPPCTLASPAGWPEAILSPSNSAAYWSGTDAGAGAAAIWFVARAPPAA